MTVVMIPVPPSLNHAYANRKGGRKKTDEYRAWQFEAILRIKSQRPERIHGPVIVDISIPKQRGDIDNRIKPTLDALVMAKVIDDDRHVEEVRARWVYGAAVCRVSIKEALNG